MSHGGTVPRQTVLIDLPFASLYRPNLALETLRGCLVARGHSCDVWQSKYGFARMIGRERYDALSDQLSYTHLPGDWAFIQALGGSVVAPTQAHSLESAPDEILAVLPRIQDHAVAFTKDLAERVLTGGCDLVGLNLTFQIAPALALAKALFSFERRPWVVIGGGNCEAGMGEALMHQVPWVDFVCQGEGESLIVELLETLSANKVDPGSRAWMNRQRERLSQIQGLVWRDVDRIIVNGSRARGPRDLDELPMPVYEPWLKEAEGSGLGIRKEHLSITFETSRGCWYGEKSHCTFCGLNGPSLAFRSKSPKRVLTELAGLVEHRVPFAESADLILDMRFFDNVIPELAQRKTGPSLFFETKANLTRDHLVALRNARINNIQPGIESLDTAILKRMRKGVSAFQNVRLLRDCFELGITVDWSLLYGFPNEEPEAYRAMSRRIQLLEHLQPPRGGCARVVLNRFSPLFEDAKRFGIAALRPLPAYLELFGHVFPDVSQIAYFFEGEIPERPGIRDAQQQVIEGTTMWHAAVGDSALISLEGTSGTTLLDRRCCAVREHALLRGVERDVFTACRVGANVRTLERTLQHPLESIYAALEALMDSGWILEVDGRFLSLAVRGESLLPRCTPDILREPVSVAAYCARARMLSEVS